MIKLLLTSAGISNKSIHEALVELLGKPIAESKALFIPTAVYPFPNGAYMAWRAVSGKGKTPLTELGWKSLGLLELTALPSIDKNLWMQDVEEADALLVWGGNPVYLAHWLHQSGLAEVLLSLQRNLVYVGVSAGSMATASIFGVFDTPEGEINRKMITARGAGLVDFAIITHFVNKDFPDASEPNAAIWAAKIPAQVYAIDDQTAIKVMDGTVEIISEGYWTVFNK